MPTDRTRLLRLSLALLPALAGGCEDPRFENLTPLQREGLEVYKRHCSACHNMNASKEGTQGPPIAGSSIELLEARVLRLQYPPGYTPKRPGSKQMTPAMPHLKDKIPALHAFLDPALHPSGGD